MLDARQRIEKAHRKTIEGPSEAATSAVGIGSEDCQERPCICFEKSTVKDLLYKTIR